MTKLSDLSASDSIVKLIMLPHKKRGNERAQVRPLQQLGCTDRSKQIYTTTTHQKVQSHKLPEHRAQKITRGKDTPSAWQRRRTTLVRATADKSRKRRRDTSCSSHRRRSLRGDGQATEITVLCRNSKASQDVRPVNAERSQILQCRRVVRRYHLEEKARAIASHTSSLVGPRRVA